MRCHAGDVEDAGNSQNAGILHAGDAGTNVGFRAGDARDAGDAGRKGMHMMQQMQQMQRMQRMQRMQGWDEHATNWINDARMQEQKVGGC